LDRVYGGNLKSKLAKEVEKDFVIVPSEFHDNERP